MVIQWHHYQGREECVPQSRQNDGIDSELHAAIWGNRAPRSFKSCYPIILEWIAPKLVNVFVLYHSWSPRVSVPGKERGLKMGDGERKARSWGWNRTQSTSITFSWAHCQCRKSALKSLNNAEEYRYLAVYCTEFAVMSRKSLDLRGAVGSGCIFFPEWYLQTIFKFCCQHRNFLHLDDVLSWLALWPYDAR